MPALNKNKIIQVRVSENDFQKLTEMAAQANISLSKFIRLKLAQGNVVISPHLKDIVAELYLIRCSLEQHPDAESLQNLSGRIDALCQYCASWRGNLRTYRI